MKFMYCMKPQWKWGPESHNQQEKLCERGGQSIHSEVTQRWWNHLPWRFSDKTNSWDLVIPWDRGMDKMTSRRSLPTYFIIAQTTDQAHFVWEVKLLLSCAAVLQSASFNYCMLCSQLDLDNKPTFLYIPETKIKRWTRYQFHSALQKWWKSSWFHSKRDV